MRVSDFKYRLQLGERRATVVLLVAVIGSMAGVTTAAPKPNAAKPKVGEASFYGKEFAGQKTASGAPFNPQALTAASPTLPLGTKAKVVNQENGRSVNVTITDRGPYVEDRLLDVSAKAAERLDMKDDGVATVKVVPKDVPK